MLRDEIEGIVKDLAPIRFLQSYLKYNESGFDMDKVPGEIAQAITAAFPKLAEKAGYVRKDKVGYLSARGCCKFSEQAKALGYIPELL